MSYEAWLEEGPEVCRQCGCEIRMNGGCACEPPDEPPPPTEFCAPEDDVAEVDHHPELHRPWRDND